MKTCGWVGAALVSAFAPSVAAYPSYIGFGHAACMDCHVSPLGSEMLNDSGRVFAATTLAQKPFYDADIDNEELGRRAGLFGDTPQQQWVRAQVSYRELFYASHVQAVAATQTSVDEADLAIELKPTETVWLSFTGGYADHPQPGGFPSGHFVSREHYAAVRARENVTIAGGFMDVAYGLRGGDPFAINREATGLGANSQSYSALVRYSNPVSDLYVQALLGNAFLDSSLREKGAAADYETEFVENARVGASLYYARSAVLNRAMGAVHARIGIEGGSSLLTEAGLVRWSPLGAASSLDGYFMLAFLGRITRGVHFVCSGEFNTADFFAPTVRTIRMGPGVEWYPMQRLSFKAYLQASRAIGGVTVTPDNVDAIARVHLWF